jgi:hypothetical protein
VAQREPSAAQALYPHLRQGTPKPVEQRRTGSIADAIFPGLSREAKAREAFAKRNRDNLLQALREANANLGKGRR